MFIYKIFDIIFYYTSSYNKVTYFLATKSQKDIQKGFFSNIEWIDRKNRKINS